MSRDPRYIWASYDMDGLKIMLQRGLIAGLCTYATPVFAQGSLSASEVVKRAANAQNAYSLLEDGDTAYRKGDFKNATSKYSEALSSLPKNADATRGLRASAVQRFTQASLAYAQNLKRLGDYEKVKEVLAQVDSVSPDNIGVAQFRAKTDDPIRTNPSLTPEHSAKIDKVRRLLYEAQGYYDLGKFDRAFMTYEDILRIDKYNKAARRGMEKVNAARSDYGNAARDETRHRALNDVEAAWENKKFQDAPVSLVSQQPGVLENAVSGLSVMEKLNTIQVDQMQFRDATLEEAIDFLRITARNGDTTTLNEEAKGLDFIVQLGSPENPIVQKVLATTINLDVKNIPLLQALKMITQACGTQYRVDQYAVVIYPTGASDPTIIRREFRVPPGFLTSSAITENAEEDPFGGGGGEEGGLLVKRLTAVEKLKSLGMPFPEGAGASFNKAAGTIVVRNTAENLDFVAQIVEVLASTEPIGVAIRTTIIDITQEELEELGFDTVLGQLSFGSNYSASGGTTGTGDVFSDTIGGNPVSAGLRSGTLAGDTSSLDALLNRGAPATASGSFSSGIASGASTISIPSDSSVTSPRAPGILSLRGLIDGNAHEILMRGFSQKKSADILVRPEVLTRSGQNALIFSGQEFFYPEDFEPAEIPNSVSGGQNIVTPTTPTSFVMTELGVRLEVLPEVSADRKFIEVAVKPQIREFEGFINYGTPIVGSNAGSGFNPLGGGFATNTAVGVLTPNEILVPLIKTVKSNTNVVIQDGHTIVMSGLRSQTREKIEDKVPLLGDIPYIGRLFRSDALSVQSRHVIILVNVELLDPSGKPYRNR